jgi:hypothetical protein
VPYFVGVPYFVIIGGSVAVAYAAWLATTYKRPADPQTILLLYLLALAALAAQVVHTVKGFVADFPGEIAAVFRSLLLGREVFAITVMGGFAAVWILTAVGLIYRNPFANYLLWFFIVGPGVVNTIAHVSFPFIARTDYFPGLITVILPTS